MQDFKLKRSLHQRSFRYYVALVLGSALLFSALATLTVNPTSAYLPDFLVTEVSLTADNTNMSGPCPTRLGFHGYIATNGAGTVRYTFMRSDGAIAPPEEIYFKQAGRQAVSTDWTLGRAGAPTRFDGWLAIRILSPNSLASFTANFTLDCRQQSVATNLMHGRFRVMLNGFRVNHQTYQGLWAAWDTVEFSAINVLSMDDNRGLQTIHWNITDFRSDDRIGASPPNRVRGGLASSRGGLKTGDTYPSQIPGGPSAPNPNAIPTFNYFDGELIQNTNAVVIIPSIWVVDENRRSDSRSMLLQFRYDAQLDRDLSSLEPAVSAIIRGPRPLALDSYLRPGASMGLRFGFRVAIGVPQDRPIGLTPEGNQFGFIPQVLVLTYDSAEYMGRTDFGIGRGIVPVRYVDPQGFAGDYTLYLQISHCQPGQLNGIC